MVALLHYFLALLLASPFMSVLAVNPKALKSPTRTRSFFAQKDVARRSTLVNGGAPALGLRQETNAQRMARGMPPLKPSNLFIPSRVRRVLPSSSPTLSGRIRVVRKSDGQSAGFMLATGDVVGQATSAGLFQFTLPTTPNQLVEMNSVESPGKRIILYAEVAKFPEAGNEYIGPGSRYRGYSYLGTLSFPAGTIPARRVDATLRKFLFALTTVWLVDRDTGAVSARFTNYNGGTFTVYFLLQTSSSGETSIVYTGDIAAYKADNPTLTLEEVLQLIRTSYESKNRRKIANSSQPFVGNQSIEVKACLSVAVAAT